MPQWSDHVTFYVYPDADSFAVDESLGVLSPEYRVPVEALRGVPFDGSMEGFAAGVMGTLDVFESLEATGEVAISSVTEAYHGLDDAGVELPVFASGGVLEGALAQNPDGFSIVLVPGIFYESGAVAYARPLPDGRPAVFLDPLYLDEAVIGLEGGGYSQLSLPRVLADELTHIADPALRMQSSVYSMYVNGRILYSDWLAWRDEGELNSIRVSNLYASFFGEPPRMLTHLGCTLGTEIGENGRLRMSDAAEDLEDLSLQVRYEPGAVGELTVPARLQPSDLEMGTATAGCDYLRP